VDTTHTPSTDEIDDHGGVQSHFFVEDKRLGVKDRGRDHIDTRGSVNSGHSGGSARLLSGVARVGQAVAHVG
jgi:hypothetical protein